MADISSYLKNIEEAKYGERVRGSIHDAIDIINKVSENTLTVGTTDPTSVTGYFKNSLYLNSTTDDLFKCSGTAWTKITNLRGNGITSISKTSTSGLVDTYTITFSYGDTTTFTVNNGNGITNIAKTGTSGLIDTYTITFSDGTNTTFTVNNGNGISSITKTSTAGLVDTYTISYTNGTNSTFNITNGEKGDQGIQGPKGDTGEQGAQGPKGDGNAWYTGTALDGTGTGYTGVAGSKGDLYLNTVNANVYTCVSSGTDSTAIWNYSTNIKGSSSSGSGDMKASDYVGDSAPKSVHKADYMGNIENSDNVDISNPTAGQGIVYNAVTGHWENGNVASESSGVWVGTQTDWTNDTGSISKSKLKTDDQVILTDDETTPTFVDSDDFDLSSGLLKLSTSVTQKLSKLDSDGKIAYSDVKNTPTIPSKTSDLTNDSGYLVASDIVGKADKTLISDAYSSSKTYSVGEYCIDNNKIWKKIGASEVGVTPTEGSSWTECSAGKELSDINTNLISILGDKLFNFKTNETGYKDMTQEGTTVSNVVGTVYIPKGKYLIISSAYFPYNSTNFSRRIVKLSVGQTDASKNITLCDWSCARAMWANSPMFSSILNNEIDRTYYVLAVNQWLSGDRITLPVQILGLYLGEPD